MINLLGLIAKVSDAKEGCYKSASEAYNNSDTDLQKYLYAKADELQLVLNDLIAKQDAISAAHAAQFGISKDVDLDDYSVAV